MSIEKQLASIKEWAQKKAQGGGEPPWAWYQYMKLIEAISSIQAGTHATTTDNSLRVAERQGKVIQLGVANCSPENAQSHPSEEQVQLPM